jgi:ParB family chromosome partitioning protein
MVILTLDIGLETLDFLCHPARMAKPALGRGLGALLGGNPPLTQPAPAPSVQPVAATVAPPPAPDNRERVLRVPLNKIRASALQPRKEFSDEALRELADSIREQGIVQPLIVRERDGFFELIAGERRWRAAQLLQLPEVPVITREADDRAVLELALIENLQRENLNALEEAQGYAQLAEQFQLTQEEIALKVGKSRAAVANATRLLKLPSSVQKFVREGRISVGHAKVILGLTDEKNQNLAAERVIKEGLNVRQTEGLIAKLQSRGSRVAAAKSETVAAPNGDPHVADLESKLREVFATKVQLNYAQGKGSLEISFFSDAELERILQILGVKPE